MLSCRSQGWITSLGGSVRCCFTRALALVASLQSDETLRDPRVCPPRVAPAFAAAALPDDQGLRVEHLHACAGFHSKPGTCALVRALISSPQAHGFAYESLLTSGLARSLDIPGSQEAALLALSGPEPKAPQDPRSQLSTWRTAREPPGRACRRRRCEAAGLPRAAFRARGRAELDLRTPTPPDTRDPSALAEMPSPWLQLKVFASYDS